MNPSFGPSKRLAAWARQRELELDDVAGTILPGVESLLARLRALGDRLTPVDTPPAERRELSRRR